MPQNFAFIQGSIEKVTQELWESTDLSDRFHFVHCAFAETVDSILPKILNGFEYIDNHVADRNGVFIVAIKSDIAARHPKSLDPIDCAMEVVEMVMEKFPERRLFLISYDKGTPVSLQRSFNQADLRMESFFSLENGECDIIGLCDAKSHLTKGFCHAVESGGYIYKKPTTQIGSGGPILPGF